VSAFDVVLRSPCPTRVRADAAERFWFERLATVISSHFLSADADEIVTRIPALADHGAACGPGHAGATHDAVPFECVVRGYVTGSAWAEYKQSGTLAGEPLPPGLVESARIGPADLLAATKATWPRRERDVHARRQSAGPALAEHLNTRA